MNNLKAYVAEFIGTLVLVVFGCGTAATIGTSSEAGTGYLLTALAFGLVIVAMAYSVGNVSGGHVNPAVSLAMTVAGRMDIVDFAGYVVAQFLGATVGAGILVAIVGTDSGLAANSLYNGSFLASFLIELILTFVFVLTVLGVTSRSEFSSVAGLVIGLSLTLVHIFGIAYTGTSVNPARSFGPALFAGGDALKALPCFLIAPLLGGALAGVCWLFLDDER
ncbi:MAG: aquaporin [Bacillota bacterium]|uniref:Aquaporin Z n=1 Tax=[Clostridium] aminophilum TaxID=1526 RepID=A0A1I6IF82_9FIRM|nr:aquaporin [[Clostridium] aminophilum]MDT3844190.1 aquaporin [Bacillota bacterium]SFR65358.1 aquaporin Z [[Clostridium] aminophilum]